MLENPLGGFPVADEYGLNPLAFDSPAVGRRSLGIELGDERVWGH
jgi:hypothetical protein